MTVLFSGTSVLCMGAALTVGLDHWLGRLAALVFLVTAAVVLGMALEHRYPSSPSTRKDPQA